MNIKNIILKKKEIDIKEIIPKPNMRIDFHREDKMPEVATKKNFDCIIELSSSITDKDNKDSVLIKMVVSYIIFVELDEKEKYSRQLSNLLKEANYPPIPITIKAKE